MGGISPTVDSHAVIYENAPFCYTANPFVPDSVDATHGDDSFRLLYP